MNEAKKAALVGMLQDQIGLSSEDVGKILALVACKLGGDVVPGLAPGEPAPEVLMQPQTTVLPRPQAERLQEYAAAIGQISAELRSGSGWRSRKLWVALTTIAGMMAQLPMQTVLPPLTQAAICAVAVVYIIVQGHIDHSSESKSTPLEPAA